MTVKFDVLTTITAALVIALAAYGLA